MNYADLTVEYLMWMYERGGGVVNCDGDSQTITVR